MKKTKHYIFKQGFLASVLALTLATGAFGATETFKAINFYGVGPLGTHLSANGLSPSTLSDTFDLTADGFVPGVDTATAGLAYFDVTDYLDPLNIDRLSIDLGSIDALPKGTVQDYLFVFNSSEGSSALSLLADINTDGKLDYEITATRGNFYVNGAELDVVATAPNAAPDGGVTVALLGLALLGIFAFARKFRWR